jgi:hypothetical protein
MDQKKPQPYSGTCCKHEKQANDCSSIEDSTLNSKQKSCTDLNTMSAIYNESEAWLKLDWVQKKLEGRWDAAKLSRYVAFYL